MEALILLQIIIWIILIYGSYRIFFYSHYHPKKDDEPEYQTKRCPVCGCVNLKKASVCRDCGEQL